MAAGKQLHGNFTPAHDAGCAAQCFEGVQRGNLIILPVNPRPQAATRTGENLRDTEQRIADLSLLEKQIDTYRKLKPVYDRYKASKDKEKFLRGFESEIILFEAAAREIKIGRASCRERV